ncbi:hypothetical protein HYPSUDRAFT_205608 [Hypholoma sublateritium FD-334 SS-4]|uniref:Uncharacterized protein n=1 Tax=Hypholoma sublateritium (strain FD-334 SS-4) TaxID=945553 RepID=A0A0D2PCY6_HYPSF|nr:hypothetical protein HYPSUDRAFT_205608 [Hypholoma sublateritium FD-334 SS-4]
MFRSKSAVLEQIGDAVGHAKEKANGKKESLTHKMTELGIAAPLVDLLTIQLPKMCVVGSADPYFFVAEIDSEISFSTVKENTLALAWNNIWRMKNVPASADLMLKIMDKDEGSLTDDFIGTAEVGVRGGAKEVELEDPLLKLRSVRCTFWLKVCISPLSIPLTHAQIDSTPASEVDPPAFPASMQGTDYARRAANGFGVIEDAPASRAAAHWHGGRGRSGGDGAFAQCVQLAMYTHVVASDDGALRFSETGRCVLRRLREQACAALLCDKTSGYLW